jgi:acyl dehydratase
MPEEFQEAVRVSGLELREGAVFELGDLNCSEQEIVAFAEYVDPLPLHVDRDSAAAGLFGGIVASGAQLYIEFHKRWFVPSLGKSVLCGLGITNWNFLKPHIPGVTYTGRIRVLTLAPKPEKGVCRVHWHYTFHDPEGEMVQEIEVRVLHQIEG